MGWLWVWLRDREERRAEAAVRRQLAAIEGDRRHYRWPQEFDEPRQEVALVENLADLLAECRRADALAGEHGGFVTTARIRELLGGEK